MSGQEAREELRSFFLDQPSASLPALVEFSSSCDEDVQDVDAIIDRILAAGYRKYPEPEQGSCWDEAPSIRVPTGECAPMPMLCELRAGHKGAHRSGLAQWMRGRQRPEPDSA